MTEYLIETGINKKISRLHEIEEASYAHYHKLSLVGDQRA